MLFAWLVLVSTATADTVASPVEKGLSVDASIAQHQLATERLNKASAEAYAANLHAIQASAGTVRPVVAESMQKLFPSPSPPPPPFTTAKFGLDFWDAATSANFDKAASILSVGAEEGVNYSYKNLGEVQGDYQPSAHAASHGIHVLFDRPPPPPAPPTAAAALAGRDEAVEAAGRANKEWMHATAAAVGATADLVGARVKQAVGGGEKTFPFGNSNFPPAPPPPPEAPPPSRPSEPEPAYRFFFQWGLRAAPSAENRQATPPRLWMAVAGCAIGAAVGGAVAGGVLAAKRLSKHVRAGAREGAPAAAAAMV